jgi:hypothetical protein
MISGGELVGVAILVVIGVALIALASKAACRSPSHTVVAFINHVDG